MRGLAFFLWGPAPFFWGPIDVLTALRRAARSKFGKPTAGLGRRICWLTARLPVSIWGERAPPIGLFRRQPTSSRKVTQWGEPARAFALNIMELCAQAFLLLASRRGLVVIAAPRFFHRRSRRPAANHSHSTGSGCGGRSVYVGDRLHIIDGGDHHGDWSATPASRCAPPGSSHGRDGRAAPSGSAPVLLAKSGHTIQVLSAAGHVGACTLLSAAASQSTAPGSEAPIRAGGSGNTTVTRFDRTRRLTFEV